MIQVNTNVQTEWINCQNTIYRKNNLVFAVVLKNASTWAASILSHNGFEQGRANQIDWNKDHVFGFIQDPFVRRLKGIAQDLLTFYSVEQYLLNNLGHRFWVDHLVFGPHSMPLSLCWHDKMYEIDWIPMDRDEINLELVLKKIFHYHGMEYQATLDNDRHQHKSDDYQIEIFQRIKHIVGNGSGHLNLMLAKDIDFYNTVIQNFNCNGNTWDEISWLKNIAKSKKTT